MRSAIAVGIGLFIAFIGLRNGGLIVAHSGTLVALNPRILSADVAVFGAGLVTAAVLQIREVRGAILLGMAASAIVALVFGKIHFAGVFGFPQIESPSLFRLNLAAAANLRFVPLITVLLFMNIFDTVGTVIGVSQQARSEEHT